MKKAYFGGKWSVAHLVWERFGNVANYIEPFFGSGAILLSRPSDPGTETVNDLDCMIANFFRSVQSEPEIVSHYADWPVNESDLLARHRWLVGQKPEMRNNIESSPDYYDAKIAGWWCWGMCVWIGSGWCSGNAHKQLPHLGDAGRGIHKKSWRDVNPKLPHLGNAGRGIHKKSWRNGIHERMIALYERMRYVRVCCGDWTRVMGPSVTTAHGLTGVFLDPPYGDVGRDTNLYNEESLTVAADCRRWCEQNGNNPLLRIALCGYDGEHKRLEDMEWTKVVWKAHGGMGNQNKEGNQNRFREAIWFSPHCLNDRQISLF